MLPYINQTLTVDIKMMEHLVQPVEDYLAPVFILNNIRGRGNNDPDTDLFATYNMQSGEIVIKHPDYDRPYMTLYASQMPHHALRYSTIRGIAQMSVIDSYHAEAGEETERGDIALNKGKMIRLAWDADLHLMPIYVGYGYLSWFDHDAQVLIDIQDEPSF